ncbi:hypothetical protein [Methanobrevibacter arboriphilus]|nr:hypothetical protein [Methanobrevibacter arboriphilus]
MFKIAPPLKPTLESKVQFFMVNSPLLKIAPAIKSSPELLP